MIEVLSIVFPVFAIVLLGNLASLAVLPLVLYMLL